VEAFCVVFFFARALRSRRGKTSQVRQGWKAGVLRLHTGEEDVPSLALAVEDLR
jgi:hypothetical protein